MAANRTIAVQVQFNGINEATNSIAALQKELKALKDEQKKADPTSSQYKELADLVALYTAELKTLQDEQKKVNASFQDVKLAAGSYAAIQEETEKLTEEYKLLAVGVNATQDEYDALRAKIQANNATLAAMNAELKAVNKVQTEAFSGVVGSVNELKNRLKQLRDEQNAADPASAEYAKLSTEIASTTSELKALEAEQKKVNAAFEDSKLVAGSTNAMRKELIALNKILDNTAQEINGKVNPEFVELTRRSRELTNQISQAEQASGRFQRNVGNYPDIGASIRETFDSIGPSLIGAFAIGNVVELAISGLKTAIETGKQFESSISNLSAITGLTGSNLEFLSIQARELGKSSALGASQTAEAFKIIGSAEPELLKSKEALVGVTESAIILNQAAGGELSEAATSLTTVMNQFAVVGETADETILRSIKTIDVLAAGSQVGAAEVGDLAESMKKAGIPANSLGLSLETTVAAIETLADKTIKAEIAGNGFKNFLVLSAKNGIGMKDGVLDLNQALTELEPIQNDVTALAKLYGTENLVVAQTLIQNREKVLQYTAAVSKSGVATEQARINMDNLAGDTKKLNAALEDISLGVFEQIKGETRGITQALTEVVNFISVGLSDGLDDLLSPIKTLYSSIFTLIKTIGSLFTIFGSAKKEGNAFGTILKVVGGIAYAVSVPLRAVIFIVQTLFDNFISVGKAIKGFIDESPTLTAVLDKLIAPFRLLGDAIGYVSGAIGSLFDGPALQSNAQILINTFGSIAKAGEALRNELGASKAEYEEFVKSFDKSLVSGKGIAEARQIVEQEFNNFLKSKREAQQQSEDESLTALTEQLAAEETLRLESSLKGLEILRKRQKAELQSQEGFFKLSKGQQLILLEKIDREINAKRKALNANRVDKEKEAAEAEKEAAIKRTDDLLQLRRQLSDALLANEDEETDKLLKAEEERYTKQQQLALDNAAKITLDVKASQEEVQEATRIQDAILEQLQIEHYGKLNEIAADGLRQELETQAAADAQRVAQQTRINDLSLEAVETELANEDKNFERRRKLIRLQGEFQIKALEMETMAQLKAAQSDEERTKIMEVEAQKRIAIVKDVQAKLEAEKGTLEQQFARVLGISPEELAKFQEVFKEGLQVLNQAIDQFFQARLAAIDVLIDNQQKRIDLASEAAEKQVERVASLEERLATATGARRERLIALIDQERQRERALFAEKVKQEKAKAAIEAQKIEIENKQAKIRKAQAIAQAVANTAVGITRTIAEVPKVDFGVSTAILIGLYAALGAAQVALIASQKFAKGGMVDGPSHDQGGVPMAVPSQNRYVELEGGEFVTNKRATERNADVLDLINREGHRTSFTIEPRKFANGGAITPTPNFASVNAAIANQNGSAGISEAKVDRMIDLLAIVAAKDPELNVVEFSRRLQSVRVTEQRGKAF